MHQTVKGKQWHFGMKGQIRVGVGPVLVHTVIGAAASVNEVTQGNSILHGGEAQVFAVSAIQLSALQPGMKYGIRHQPLRYGRMKLYF